MLYTICGMLAPASGARSCYSSPERLTTTTYQEYAIMATVENTASTEAQSDSETFHDLHASMLEIIGHLQCADLVLFDLQNVPGELQPAAIVLHRAVAQLDQLHNDLDTWHTRHHHSMKPRDNDEAISPAVLPGTLRDYFSEQQHRALELQGMLELLVEQTAQDDRVGGALGIAAREAHALNVALDSCAIRRVLKEAAEVEEAASS